MKINSKGAYHVNCGIQIATSDNVYDLLCERRDLLLKLWTVGRLFLCAAGGAIAQALTGGAQTLNGREDRRPVVALDGLAQRVAENANILAKWSVFLSAVFVF